MRALLLTALLLAPLLPVATAQEDALAWWDERWHFRLPLTLSPDATDPATGSPVSLRGATDALVLVPLDLTASLRRASGSEGAGWPLDTAGQPLSWTFLPESIRVVEQDRVLAARFLPVALDPSTAPVPSFDPRGHAAGTLALLLPGLFDAPRRVHVYFDIVENGPKPPPAPSEQDAARLDALASAGPGVFSLFRVPPAHAVRLHLVAPFQESTVRLERLPPGAAPERLSETRVPAGGHAQVTLPVSAAAYDVRLVASAPTLPLLDARGDPDTTPAFLHAAVDGGRAGHRFLVPPLENVGGLEVVGTTARTTVVLRDAATGAELGRATLGRLGSHVFPAPTSLVRIEASAPVLILSRPAGAPGDAFLHQAAPLTGGAQGTLLVAGRAGGHAATADAPATLRAFPLARPQEVLSGRAGDPPRETWISQASARPAPEAWAFASDAPAAVLVGRDGYAPLHGVEGRAFRVPLASATQPPEGPALDGALLAPFSDTTVTLRAQALNGTTLASATTTLPAFAALAGIPGGAQRLVEEGTVLTVSATKPVFLAAWREGAGGVAPLPALPARAGVQEERLEFFGPLLAWSEPTKEILARSGEQVRLSLELANRGRAAGGGPLVEDVALSLRAEDSEACPSTWELSLAATSLPAFAAPGVRAADVFVRVPPDARPGDCVEAVVRAASSVDPAHAPEARFVVRARSGFQPELRVLAPEGPTTTHRVGLDGSAPTSVALRLRNLGAETGRARVALAPAPGYAASLHGPDGAPLDGLIEVPGNGTALLRLDLAASTGEAAPWDFFVQAIDEADPTSRDEVVVSATPRANVTLAAVAEPRRVTPAPGGNATATLRVENAGADVEVRVRLASAPEGWTVRATPERVLLRAAGTRDEQGRALDLAEVRLEVAPPPDARVGDAAQLVLAVEPTLSPASGLRVPLGAFVANDFALDVALPALLALDPAARATVLLPLVSKASAAMDVKLRGLAAPRGWVVDLDGLPLRLTPGEEGALRVRHEATRGAPAGAGTLRIELSLEDGVSPSRVVMVEVPTFTREVAVTNVTGLPASLRLAPGEIARVHVRLDNDGNAPLEPALVARSAPEANATLTLPAGALAPLASQLATLEVRGPAAGFGRVGVELVENATGRVLAKVDVEEARRDLVIASARAARTPEGVPLLDLTLENRGDLPVPALRVRVLGGARPLLEREVAAPMPGATIQHVLLVGGAVGDARVVVESADGAPDASPADNEARVAFALDAAPRADGLAGLREVSAPSPTIVLFALVVLVLLGRRRA